MLILREPQLWDQIKVHLTNYQLAPTWARRFETKVQAGIPDVELRVGYMTGHIELKISHAKRATTSLKPGLRAEQHNWLENFRGPLVYDGTYARRPPAGVMVAVPYINHSIVYVSARAEDKYWWGEERSFEDWYRRSRETPEVTIFSYDNAAAWKSFFHAWMHDPVKSYVKIERVSTDVG